MALVWPASTPKAVLCKDTGLVSHDSVLFVLLFDREESSRQDAVLACSALKKNQNNPKSTAT